MITREYLRGYEEYLKYKKEVTHPFLGYVLFTGTKLSDTGKSWCPDCVEAEPFIEAGFESVSMPNDAVLVTVEVGDRAYWKDPNCPFRTDSSIQLKVLPTLVKWASVKRLEGEQLLNPELIEMLLTDEDD